MKKFSLGLLLATLFLLGCNSAPLFSETEGEKMTTDFIHTLQTDPAAAYLETDAVLQSANSEEAFMAFAAKPVIVALESLAVKGIAVKSAFYDSDYGGAVARITLNGDCVFTDGETGTFNVIWSYSFDKEKWEVAALNVLADRAQ